MSKANQRQVTDTHEKTDSVVVSPQPKKQSFISALGLDIGRRRIGVAGCDGTGLIASGLTTIERKSFELDLAQLKHLAQERRVQVLVVGLPYSMDGSLGKQAQEIQKLAKRYAQALQLSLEYTDERLTSFQAEQLLQAQNISPSRNKGLIDRKAAALILQQWLDKRRTSLTTERKLEEKLSF
ncbi:Holliday junction resolvase RuvX [Gloeocapsopsis dulcis]|uniref:Putative pre-16S rRNA nuclease n=1 Tax=Gloeocapsopsis dulcis AAB1 = 1H9 TaxID=1433147 RepID=A0A6N8FXV8_9CHRO|nr:Holliday junction resolvase RuvX [Gloeocapsopsis dulcis]MUL37970.1 Holliday junction resolvase RuvX [Gloeocapsopsis dulcis AAB1 = 1H9]WNN87364.1 Holliday junction resolvase RuvX [Gloeocapsopsis dulcis]